MLVYQRVAVAFTVRNHRHHNAGCSAPHFQRFLLSPTHVLPMPLAPASGLSGLCCKHLAVPTLSSFFSLHEGQAWAQWRIWRRGLGVRRVLSRPSLIFFRKARDLEDERMISIDFLSIFWRYATIDCSHFVPSPSSRCERVVMLNRETGGLPPESETEQDSTWAVFQTLVGWCSLGDSTTETYTYI